MLIFKKNLANFLKTLANFKYFLPPDVYERHKFIGSHILKNSKVLDVGGSLTQLNKFSKARKIITADIKKPADIIYNGKKIPVSDSSFDIVTSIDVLEHIKKENRQSFVKELYRIAKNKIIISAPLGTKKHVEYENKILNYYKRKNIHLPYLKEHVEIGLPTVKEINWFMRKYRAKIFFSGDIRITKKLLKIHNFEVKNNMFNYIFFIIKLLFNFIINSFMYNLEINRPQTENTNRFYLIIEKHSVD